MSVATGWHTPANLTDMLPPVGQAWTSSIYTDSRDTNMNSFMFVLGSGALFASLAGALFQELRLQLQQLLGIPCHVCYGNGLEVE